MKNYNDITIMSLGFFLSDQDVLEWFLSELMGRQIKLARPPETAMPWEEVALTPDIRAVSEDQEDIYLLSIGRCGFKEGAMWELKSSTCDEFQSKGRVHNILIAPDEEGMEGCVEKGNGGRFFYTILPIGGCGPSSPNTPRPNIRKLLDFLCGRNEDLWVEEELFKTILGQSPYQSYWADLLRWRKKVVYAQTYQQAIKSGQPPIAAEAAAGEEVEVFECEFLLEEIENINRTALEMKKLGYPAETAAVVLEVPIETVTAIQEGLVYTEDDMKVWYLTHYTHRLFYKIRGEG